MVREAVREAVPEDAAGIARVQVASWQAAYPGLISEARLAAMNVAACTESWRRILAKARQSSTTVFDGAAAITGFASVGRSRDLAGWGEIWAIYVAPDQWGRGVGSALFADAMGYLAGQQLSRVMLWMLEGNGRALQFYQGNGFVLDGARKIEDGLPQLRLRWER